MHKILLAVMVCMIIVVAVVNGASEAPDAKSKSSGEWKKLARKVQDKQDNGPDVPRKSSPFPSVVNALVLAGRREKSVLRERQRNELYSKILQDLQIDPDDTSTIQGFKNPNYMDLRLMSYSFADVINLKGKPGSKLADKILHPNKNDPQLKHWLANRAVAIEKFKNKFNIKIEPSGTFIDVEYGFLAAAPDGFIDIDAILIVRCPLFIYHWHPTDLPSGFDKSKLGYEYNEKDDNAIISLKPGHSYYHDVQGQLHITRKKRCYFVIWTKYDVVYTVIDENEDYWNDNKDSLVKFYKETMLPLIVEKQIKSTEAIGEGSKESIGKREDKKEEMEEVEDVGEGEIGEVEIDDWEEVKEHEWKDKDDNLNWNNSKATPQMIDNLSRKIFGELKIKSTKQKIEIERITAVDKAELLKYRNCRLMSHHFGDIILNGKTPSKKMISRILHPNHNELKYQDDNRDKAIEQFIFKANSSLKVGQEPIKVNPCGIFVDVEYGVLAAEPDGLIDTDSILIVHCPLKIRSWHPLDANDHVKANKLGYGVKDDTEMIFDQKLSYYHEIQSQLYLTGRQYCYFVIWTEKGISYALVSKESNYWPKYGVKLEKFYVTHLLRQIAKEHIETDKKQKINSVPSLKGTEVGQSVEDEKKVVQGSGVLKDNSLGNEAGISKEDGSKKGGNKFTKSGYVHFNSALQVIPEEMEDGTSDKDGSDEESDAEDSNEESGTDYYDIEEIQNDKSADVDPIEKSDHEVKVSHSKEDNSADVVAAIEESDHQVQVIQSKEDTVASEEPQSVLLKMYKIIVALFVLFLVFHF